MKGQVVIVAPMYEFDSVSVSTFEASTLAAKLTEKSSDGLGCRCSRPDRQRHHGVPAAGDRRVDAPPLGRWRATSAQPPSPRSAASEPAGWATAPESAAATNSSGWSEQGASSVGRRHATPAAGTAWGSGAQTPAAPAPASSTPAVPAGWYADPAFATSCATGTGRPGPSTSRAPVSSTPIHPSLRDRRPGRRSGSPPPLRFGASRCLRASNDASHVARPRRDPDRVRTRLDRVRSVVRPGVLRQRGSRSPATTSLDDDLRRPHRAPDYLYVSHLHGDHLDEPWLRDHLRPRHRRAAPRLPDSRARAASSARSASPSWCAPSTARSSSSAG